MEQTPTINEPIRGVKSLLFFLYLIGFLFSLKVAMPSYVSSSFLEGISSESATSIVFGIASFLTIFGLFVAPHILRKIGNRKMILYLSIINIIALLGLAMPGNILTIFTLFVISYISSYMIGLCLDVFIEYHSRSEDTGRIRGSFLTAENLAWVISPVIAGFLIGAAQYGKIYLASALTMIPTVFIIMYSMHDFKDPEYHDFAFRQTFNEIRANKDVLSITMADFLLQFFYAIMAIYSPIYLYQDIHLSWFAILVIIFTILNIPFVAIEKPLGYLADKKWGEKNALIAGFIVITLSTATISFITTPSIIAWTVIMFLTRVGAAMIEVMCETYFFKKVTSRQSDLMSVFRIVGPLSYLVAALSAFVFLLIFPFKFIFLALALIMAIGLIYATAITDTRTTATIAPATTK